MECVCVGGGGGGGGGGNLSHFLILAYTHWYASCKLMFTSDVPERKALIRVG